ncbi:MAG: hypothetical protein ACKO2K_14230 [Alphaproteobacteria bacterium]
MKTWTPTRGAAALLSLAALLLAAPASAQVVLQADSATVSPRRQAVCEDTTIDCQSSADCAFARACQGADLDAWVAFGEIATGTDSATSAFIREVDRDGVTVSIGATSGGWAGDTIALDGGDCSPLGKNADTTVNGVRCKDPVSGSLVILKARQRDGVAYVKTSIRAKHRSLERPTPTVAESPLVVGVTTTSSALSDDVTPCRESPNARLRCTN